MEKVNSTGVPCYADLKLSHRERLALRASASAPQVASYSTVDTSPSGTDAARALLPTGVEVPDWGEDRFDLVWVLTRGQDTWDFAQVPQLLLNDDLLEIL